MTDLMKLDPTQLKDLLYPVIVVDQETLDILDANEATSNRYGYSHEQLLTMKVSQLRVPDERHLVLGTTEEMAAGPAIIGPLRHQTAVGDVIRTEIVSIPGELHGRPSIAGILVDATERIDAETQAHILFDRMPQGAWIHDCETLEILAVNDAAVEMYGYSREELLTMTLDQLRPDKNRDVVLELFRKNPTGELKGVYHHLRKDGTLIDVEAISAPIPFGGRRNARLGAGRDITQELAADRALQRAKASLEEAQEVTHLGSWQHDFLTNQTRRSKELCRILGVNENVEAVSIGSAYEYIHPADISRAREAVESAADGALFTLEHRIVRGDGEERWVSVRGRVQRDATGNLTSATATVLDITEQKARNEELHVLAYHDQLTGLPNRQSMKAILDKAMSRGSAAVLFIDFDSFKEINDTFGHTVGDALLQQIAARLVRITGVETCRWGGDEFVVVAPLGETQSHEDVLFQIRTALAASYEHDDQTFFITPSIGIALYPEHGDSAWHLVRNADTAMYEAKRIKNTSALFRSSMAEAARERLHIQNGLHEALRSDHLELVFQPIIAATTGKIVAAEALVRWHDPERGVQMPGSFIDLAERTGLILPIGDWVVSEACKTLDVLRSQGMLVPISVNVASQQVDTNHIVESIRKWTQCYGVQPQLLHVEITESGIMRDVDQAIAVMMELRALGVFITLDDFGAGYSSLSHLKALPLDIMKVDKSLIHGLENSERDRRIMTSVLQLAAATNLFVIAEGVETAEQADVLVSLGCETHQGFYFSRPLRAADFYEFARHRTIAQFRAASP
ncbi:MAG TPA: EAL domain-containing protein [Candidatus Baltobacteraceae bacterium]|nr:EAL domain-containing protein [Candidatus Baltobacteraceae bacterium]